MQLCFKIVLSKESELWIYLMVYLINNISGEFPQTDLHFVEPSQEPTTVVVHSKSNQFDVETSRTNQLLRSLQDVIAVLEVVVDVK